MSYLKKFHVELSQVKFLWKFHDILMYALSKWGTIGFIQIKGKFE